MRRCFWYKLKILNILAEPTIIGYLRRSWNVIKIWPLKVQHLGTLFTKILTWLSFNLCNWKVLDLDQRMVLFQQKQSSSNEISYFSATLNLRFKDYHREFLQANICNHIFHFFIRMVDFSRPIRPLPLHPHKYREGHRDAACSWW